MKRFSFFPILAIFLVLVGIVLLLVFSFNKSFNDGSYIINPDLASKYGSFVGGLVGSLFSLAGILLIFETLLAQQRTFDAHQFENKLFELIKYHRENAIQMRFRLPYEKDQIVNGHIVFVELLRQLEKILETVNSYTDNEIVLNEGDKKIQRIQIAYIAFFYGVSKKSVEIVKKMLSNYNQESIDTILKKLREKTTAYDDDIVYFGGHQHRLGHYYRHLYQTFMFIKNSKTIKNEEKYNYAKILRGQLSTHEQAFIFYNSLSPLGKGWIKNNLITEYKLIKNLPPEFIMGINPKEYFPNVVFEWEENAP